MFWLGVQRKMPTPSQFWEGRKTDKPGNRTESQRIKSKWTKRQKIIQKKVRKKEGKSENRVLQIYLLEKSHDFFSNVVNSWKISSSKVSGNKVRVFCVCGVYITLIFSDFFPLTFYPMTFYSLTFLPEA